MAPALTPTHSDLRLFFIDAVKCAAKNQQLKARPETVAYVGELLTRFARPDALYEKTQDGYRLAALADLYRRAVEAPGASERDEAYRRLGDVALFVAGLFSGSLNRKLVDVDYYIAMGEGAYSRVALHRDARCAETMYRELSHKFAGFVDVLDEVAEQAPGRQEKDVLRTYEVWLRTGSRRAARKLARSGVLAIRDGDANVRH